MWQPAADLLQIRDFGRLFRPDRGRPAVQLRGAPIPPEPARLQMSCVGPDRSRVSIFPCVRYGLVDDPGRSRHRLRHAAPFVPVLMPPAAAPRVVRLSDAGACGDQAFLKSEPESDRPCPPYRPAVRQTTALCLVPTPAGPDVSRPRTGSLPNRPGQTGQERSVQDGAMRDGSGPLYRTHSFLTHLTDTPRVSAISRFVILPFCFYRAIHAALDPSSFPTIPDPLRPICLWRSALIPHIFISIDFTGMPQSDPIRAGSEGDGLLLAQ